MRTAAIENQIDKARNRLDDMASAEANALDLIRIALLDLQDAIKGSDRDRTYAMEIIEDAVQEMTADVRDKVEQDISALEDELADIEFADLNRSSTVVL